MKALDLRTDITSAADAELETIAAEVRSIVDAGHARAVAFQIVQALLKIFGTPEHLAAFGAAYKAHLTAIAQWAIAAVDIDLGETVRMHERGAPLDLYDVSRFADLLASHAWSRANERPISLESWILHDVATCLRRACECSGNDANGYLRIGTKWVDDLVDSHNARHEHTALTLLPLIVRDARNLLRRAGMGTAAIDAMIEEARTT